MHNGSCSSFSMKMVILGRDTNNKRIYLSAIWTLNGNWLKRKRLTWADKRKKWNEPPHDKINKMTCTSSEDSGKPGHPPSLIRSFAARLKRHWVLDCPTSAQLRIWSDWAGAQADLSLRLTHKSIHWFWNATAPVEISDGRCHRNRWTFPYKHFKFLLIVSNGYKMLKVGPKSQIINFLTIFEFLV